MADDEALREIVRRAQASDPDAWEALYRRAYPRMMAYARRRLPGGAGADDAVSEAMMRAFNRIGRFQWQGAGFDAWLYGILRNVILETYRETGRTAPLTLAHDAVADDDPPERILADEEVRGVRAAFARLSPDDREILELRVVGGLVAEEVAAVVGKRPGAIRMAQSRALGRLRKLMEETTHG